MLDISPIKMQEPVIEYATRLVHQLFADVKRATGLPYAKQHLEKVAKTTGDILIPSPYKTATIAAALLHDGPEDISGFDVENPYTLKNPERKESVIYLNDLLADIKEEGQMICYMVDLMTHKKGQPYFDYINRIFDFKENRQLHICTGIIKVADRNNNMDANETADMNNLVKRYIELEQSDIETLQRFYSRTKTIDAFRKKGSFGMDIGLFTRTLHRNFEGMKRNIADDNLLMYMPLAEQELLIKIEKNNGIFDQTALRTVIKRVVVESLKMTTRDPHSLKKAGLARSAPIDSNYLPIYKEIRRDNFQPE